MHFKKVGKSYWNKYIDGIIDCRKKNLYGYSDKDSDFSGHIGVGETWGYAMGYYMLNKKYSTSKNPSESYWFKPRQTKSLFDDDKITPLQFLSCMDNSVKDLQSLNTILSSKYNNVPKNLY
ncbi:MAG: hypothetical protein MJZ00_07040 [Paludibacteraceae bacterium]|nr:hypothetical protein [Paludibacteraceae bacterium]